jgi:hypothetical protein
MSQPIINRNVQKDPLGLFVLILVFLLLVLAAARTPLDSDMWWHLRAGQTTLEAGKPVLVDQLSSTQFGEKWINHSWLAEVGMYLVYRTFGAYGLVISAALLAALSMIIIYLMMDGPALFKAFLIIPGILVAAVVWAPRPQLLSLVMFALLLSLVYLYKWKQRNLLWCLPVLFIFWSNIHGGFALGLLLLGTVIAGELLNHALGFLDVEILDWRKILTLSLWSVASILAVLVNPNGLDTWLIPFQTVGVQALQNFVAEWASPNFHEVFQQPFVWLLIGIIAAIGFSGKHLDGADFISVSLFAYLALIARRNYGPFALVTTPVFSRYLWAAYQSWTKREPAIFLSNWYHKKRGKKPIPVENKSISRPVQKVINLSIIAVLAFAVYVKCYITANPILVDALLKNNYPVDAVRWIEKNHPEGSMLNEYNWGGYLTWFLRDYPVFVDGRTDLFGDEIIGQWISMVQANEGWQELLDRWKIRLILVEPGRPLANVLPEYGWKELYRDSQSVVFGR